MLADEDRVRAMIGLTRYENGSGKEALRLRKYYRTDYLALELIKTFFLATIAYFLILTLLIAGNAEYLLDHVNSMDIRLAGSYILIGTRGKKPKDIVIGVNIRASESSGIKRINIIMSTR